MTRTNLTSNRLSTAVIALGKIIQSFDKQNITADERDDIRQLYNTLRILRADRENRMLKTDTDRLRTARDARTAEVGQ